MSAPSRLSGAEDPCPPLPQEYGPLVAELQSRAAERRQPINGAFELTERCNLACTMCYVRQPSGHAAYHAAELSPAQWLDLARAAIDHGMLFLLLTGGEVFLRPDFFDIYTPLARLGLVLTLFSNGTLITEAIAARLAEAPPSRTEITLYGATAETHEAVTGVPGSYTRAMRGIEALVRHGVPLGLKSTLTRRNVGELEAMRQLAHGLGLSFTAGHLLFGRRDGAPPSLGDCRLSAAQCVKLEATDLVADDERVDVALHRESLGNNGIFYCYAGKATFRVNSCGEMSPCVHLVQPAARPLSMGFTAAWEEVQRFVDDASSLSSPCLTCDVRGYCARCPAWSARETGTLTEPIPYLCTIARARQERYERRA